MTRVADLVKSSKAADDQGPAARIGSVIKGKWTIERLLGVGGMAAVYAATHRNGQRAALKILHADFAKEKPICERFLREAYVSNKVNHGATVQVLDDDVTEHGEPFLVMELLEGETVRDAWKRCGRTMPIGRVLQICDRVLDCLAACHAINVIHRDLKPANIFITTAGEIKVLDFGVAQMRDATAERTATGTALGTPAYMSPEQAMGLVDQLDGRADLFSVGAMMHALITGHRINNGRTEQEALVMAATKPAPSIARLAPGLPIGLIKVIDKALAWDRRNRFQDSREMQKSLVELMPAHQVEPLRGSAPPRPVGGSAPVPAMVAPLLSAPPTLLAPPAPDADASLGAGMVAAAIAAAVGTSPLSESPVAMPTPLSSRPAPAQHVPEVPIVVVPESDPRVGAVRDLMKHFDRVLPSVRQFGWSHPATERTLKTAYEAITEALKNDPTLLKWTLRPYSFMTLGHTVWEPGPPFDAIPYNLFACGMRTFTLDFGLSYDELREVLALFLLDPGRDLPPEDDLAAAFWEKALPHVRYEVVDAFAEGDAAEREAFYGEADKIEDLAIRAAERQIDRIEAKAMALSTDDSVFRTMRSPSLFALDGSTRTALLPQLEVPREAWSERYVDALVEGYLDSAANRDAPLVLASLRRSAADLAVAGRIRVAVDLSAAVIARLAERVDAPEQRIKLATAITSAMFGGETLEIVLKRLRENPAALSEFAGVFGTLGPSELTTVLGHLRTVESDELRNAFASFVERLLPGREGEVIAAVHGSSPDAIATIVDIFGRGGTPACRHALAQLSHSDDVTARIEARVLIAPSPDQARDELLGQLENPSPFARMAALRALTRHRMTGAWPAIARIVSAKSFNDLGNDERRGLLRAAILLSPESGESLALDLAKRGGVLVSESREATRTLAAELLGEHSRSRQVAVALSELSQSRWGISEETRNAAAAASKRIGQRLVAAAQQGGAST